MYSDMRILNLYRFRDKKTLENISSKIYINLSQNKFDKSFRKKMLEELFLYNPDNITKEIIYNFYFQFDMIIDLIENKIQMVIKDYIISRILEKQCRLTKKNGRLTKKGRNFILSEFSFLPSPFLKRLYSRLRYLRLDQKNLQEDYMKLTQIIGMMSEKGYVISNQFKQYYHSIDFDRVLGEYIKYKYSESYLQLILEKLKILPVSYDKKTKKMEEIIPISKEKKIAQLKKNLIYHINLCVPLLEHDQKKDFINLIVDNNFNFSEAKNLILKLSFLLKSLEYEQAKSHIISEFEQINDKKPRFGEMEIGPKGLFYKNKLKKIYIFKNKKE